jgi:hypothetical protein
MKMKNSKMQPPTEKQFNWKKSLRNIQNSGEKTKENSLSPTSQHTSCEEMMVAGPCSLD